jgi:hypothetical protein
MYLLKMDGLFEQLLEGIDKILLATGEFVELLGVFSLSG